MNSKLLSIGDYLRNIINAYSLDKHSMRMRSLLRQSKFSQSRPRQIMVEAGQPKSNQLALSIFLPVLQEALDAGTVFFDVGSANSLAKFKAIFRQYFSPIQQLSAVSLLYIQTTDNPAAKVEEIANQFQSTAVTPELLELAKYRNIVIGDLIYDTYLRRTNLPTIDMSSIEYRKVLIEAIGLVDYWFDYITNESVSAICVSHCVYLGAIPGRVGVHLGAQVFQVNTHAIYRVTDEFPHAYTDYVNYRKEFLKLPVDIRESGVKRAEERLDLRFKGEVAVDMPYSTKSAYTRVPQVLGTGIIQNNRLKVLVAIHDFYDSPHSYGNNFYPDFYIWLYRLNELSLELDYDWYVKTHPDIQGPGNSVLSEFIRQSNGFRLIPSDTSHHDLIRDGIDCVLTVFGTIAMEYPYLGRTVVNASRSNPHVAYGFSVTPRDKSHYEDVIRNLRQYCSIMVNRDEILEYYFMHNIHGLQSWIFRDQAKLLDEIGGYDASNSSRIYSYFLDSLNRWNGTDYEGAIKAFLNSKEIRLGSSHFMAN